MKRFLFMMCLVMWIYCIYYSQARHEQKERADSLYCQTIYMSLDNMSTAYSIDRVRLENTYMQNDCKSFNF